MNNIKLIIAYDGGDYLGWQRTSMGPSIEQCLYSVIEKVLQHPVIIQAASRTDAGVHANGQVINFFTIRDTVNLCKWVMAFNRLLPSSIRILSGQVVPFSFHPTLDSVNKEYRYYICPCTFQLPQRRHYSWHVPGQINFDALQNAIPLLVGKHHFGAFCNLKRTIHYESYVRHLQRLEWNRLDDNHGYFRLVGDHFLYRMARNIVGTLIDVGKGKIEAHAIKNILESKQRKAAGMTAPAHGLFLHKINYLFDGSETIN